MDVKPFRIGRYPSEVLVAVALTNRHVLLERNLAIVECNLSLLVGFFERHADTFEWVRPIASRIGFPRVNGVDGLDDMCARLADRGVLCSRGRSTTRRATYGSGSAAPTSRTPCGCSRRL